MIHSHLSRVLRTAGVALLPAVVLLCCASDAAAECGDYVRIIGQDGTVQTPMGHDQKPTDRPCQGPNCTGGPKAPIPVPPAPSSVAPLVKGLVTETDVSAGTDMGSRFDSDSDGLPVRQLRSIFHPPRA